MHIFKWKVTDNLMIPQNTQNKDTEVDSRIYQLRRHLRKSKQLDQDSSFSLRLNTGTPSKITMLLKLNQNISSLVKINLILLDPQHKLSFFEKEGDHCGYVYKTFHCRDLILNY